LPKLVRPLAIAADFGRPSFGSHKALTAREAPGLV
jgi:hypothetical protein